MTSQQYALTEKSFNPALDCYVYSNDASIGWATGAKLPEVRALASIIREL